MYFSCDAPYVDNDLLLCIRLFVDLWCDSSCRFLSFNVLYRFAGEQGVNGFVSGILFLFVDMTHSVNLLYCVFCFLVHLTGHDPCTDP